MPNLGVMGGDNSRNDDDENENDDASDQAHPHLHVLPPHLLANAVGATAEAMRRGRKVVGLVLEGVESLAALRYLVDVLAHHPDGVIDLSLQSLRPRVAASLLSTSGLAARDVRVIRRVLRHFDG